MESNWVYEDKESLRAFFIGKVVVLTLTDVSLKQISTINNHGLATFESCFLCHSDLQHKMYANI